MSNVIERCPNCGVEHELTHTGPCEVCGSALRFWCRRHSKEIGWLADLTCPECAREAAAKAAAPPPPPPSRGRAPPPRRPAEVRRPARPPRATIPGSARSPRRDPGRVVREEAGRWLPHIAAGGASLAWRLFVAMLVIVRAVFVGALLFGIVGLAYGLYINGVTVAEGVAIHTLDPDALWLGVLGMAVGGMLGLLWGLLRALSVLFSARRE